MTGTTKRCLNLSSYNYLGFAAADEYCTPRVQEVLKQYGASMCSSRLAAGASHPQETHLAVQVAVHSQFMSCIHEHPSLCLSLLYRCVHILWKGAGLST